MFMSLSALKGRLILSAVLFSPIVFAQQTNTGRDLYLLIGQSNMAGRGIISGKYFTEGDPRIFMLNKENKWIHAKHPLHFDKPSVAGVGPGLSFARKMLRKTSRNIGLIPCAVGGTSIDVWTPGAYDESTKTHPYDDMLIRLMEALKSGELKGVIWLQGESDSNPEKAKIYLVKLTELIQRLRTITNNPDLLFIAGQLGRFKDQYQHINQLLKELPDKVKNTAVASSKGLKDKGDLTHFDAASAGKMGNRMAGKMLKLQKQLRPWAQRYAAIQERQISPERSSLDTEKIWSGVDVKPDSAFKFNN
ncbi:MAG: sialate O-acetylesterase [Ferruginibacter sp.]